jgi:hypothetical protein
MYCAKCGVELADTEKVCPLCGTKAYHPDIVRGEGEKLYPDKKYPKERTGFFTPVFMTCAFILPALIVFLCDIQFNSAVTWSGYVMLALLLGYIMLILPLWFRNPNPVIFVPCDFVAIGGYLVYINAITDGDWFMSFAFPITGCIGIIVVTVVTLMRYVPKGRFFIFGGASIALGAFMLLMEFLMSITFAGVNFIGWSLYPMIALAVIGAFLLFIGICRPARMYMERHFFI